MTFVPQSSETVFADTVLLDRDDGIGRITLNRPEVGNALDAATLQALTAVLHVVCDDSSTRVVVIAGAGEMFCVGGDINTFSSGDDLPERLDSLLTPFNEAICRLASSGLPVVTAVNGAVGGGGIGLALCGDFVLAAESMKMRCGYSAIGLTPDAGSSWFLARRVGAIKAKHLFLLNESLTAQECQASGIVDEVHADADLADRTHELASRLRDSPRRVAARIKALIDQLDQRTLSEHLQKELEYIVASGSEADAREGIAAFLAKRPPRFT